MPSVMHPLIHDWNQETVGPRGIAMLDDETLRDGLQSPSVRTPTIDEKIDILTRMDALGIDTADIGLPGAGPKVAEDVERLARAIADLRLNVTKAWLSVRDNPALTVDELARERYKRDRITVVQPVSVDNVVRHLITRSTGSEDRRGQHPE